MGDQDFTGIIEELHASLEVYTEDGGNQIDGTHVESADIVEGDILVQLVDGRQFAITVGAV